MNLKKVDETNLKDICESILQQLEYEMNSINLTDLKVSIHLTTNKTMPKWGIKIDYSKYEAGQILYDSSQAVGGE